MVVLYFTDGEGEGEDTSVAQENDLHTDNKADIPGLYTPSKVPIINNNSSTG